MRTDDIIALHSFIEERGYATAAVRPRMLFFCLFSKFYSSFVVYLSIFDYYFCAIYILNKKILKIT